MKQVLQNLGSGETWLADVPVPAAARGELLIRSRASLVSSGTERMLVEFGRANLLDKVRQQPDKVRMVLEKARADGVFETLEAVRNKLDQPLELGYCNVGEVVEAGAGATGFRPGERVVSNGHHAEYVAVPNNLCARVPDAVSDDEAAFVVLGAIALQGIRLIRPTMGECVVVTGLGLIGLLAVQLLRANGCRVLGLDFDPARLELARRFGAETVDLSAGGDVESAAQAFSRGRGVDAVLITASTKSNEPVSQAARVCRKRGRIVLVGVVGLELSRADFYEKELSFQVSCSYGPGRYDPAYEQGGQDYPVGFVRWTEQRNFEAVLDLMASGAVDVRPLVSHRFEFAQAERAYDLLSSSGPSLGILLHYAGEVTAEADSPAPPRARSIVLDPATAAPSARGTVAFLGAGNYAGKVLAPMFRKAGAQLHTIISRGGVSAAHVGRKYGFSVVSTDEGAAFEHAGADTVVIATRHDAHARQVVAALRAGKHVFCEKPLCLSLDELAAIRAAAEDRPGQVLMVGFNRRFAPQVRRMHALLGQLAEPRCFILTVNAGAIPGNHWTQDRRIGGGRIVGEGCHFVDLLRHLVGSPIARHRAVAATVRRGGAVAEDRSMITLEFEDGSIGTIHYLANGNKGFPKERIEVFCGGRILQLDNFRRLRGWGWPGFGSMNLWRQDKGQFDCVRAFMDAVRSGAPPPIPREEIFEVSRVTIEIGNALAEAAC